MLNIVNLSVITETDFQPTNLGPIEQDNNPLNILLVEDVASDAMLARISMDGTHIPYKLQTMRNSDDVITSLLHDRQMAYNKVPDLMLLDLGMPGKNGFEILAELATKPAAIRTIPIVILTGHKYFNYLEKVYNLQIYAYIQKPCNVENMRQVMLRTQREKFSETRH